jgi:predicted regulator of Ras-like GTPase activity (Roadblock/LC7/MglB family)/Tfp pilus assembly protein PilF
MEADRLQQMKDEVARDAMSLAFIPLVDALRRLGRLEEARRYALRGLERHPHHAGAHDALARVLADFGEEGQAHDEWSFALRLDPGHQPSLRGLGFLAYKRRDLAAAEQHLSRALHANPADDGLATALRRVRVELRGVQDAAQENGNGNGHSQPARSSANDARQLFASMLGDGDRTALLLDRDGLVLAGTYVDGSGRDVADEIGAHLGGLAEEAARALKQLGLGRWDSLVVEAQHATVALAPGLEGAVVMVAAARDTQVGLVRRLLAQARQRATTWMGIAA